MSGGQEDAEQYRGLSGSIDIAAVGVLITLPSYYFNITPGTILGLILVVVGLLKVGYDHWFDFEDPLGIEWRSDDE